MSFVTKEWKDRIVEFAGRRKLTNVSTSAVEIVDVERNEGTVSQAGDAFSAANMNDLEERISNGFTSINENLTAIGNSKIGFLDVANRLYYDSAVKETTHSYTATQDCWFTARIRLAANNNNGSGCEIDIDNVQVFFAEAPYASGYSCSMPISLPLKQGQTISFTFDQPNYNGTNEYYAFPFL